MEHKGASQAWIFIRNYIVIIDVLLKYIRLVRCIAEA